MVRTLKLGKGGSANNQPTPNQGQQSPLANQPKHVANTFCVQWRFPVICSAVLWQ